MRPKMGPYLAVAAVIKAYLKANKISQAQLALRLELPQSTLKKWLNAKDGSVNRLNHICQDLGLSLSEVMKSVEKREVQVVQFSNAQQTYFQNNPDNFKIYWLLVNERQPLDAIAKNLEMKMDAVKRVLYQLDSLDLITVLPNDQLRLPKLRPIRWLSKGDFVERVFRDWSMTILNENLQTKQNLILQFFQLSEEAAEDFQRDLKQLEETYARRTIQEISSGATAKKKIRFLACTSEGSFFR